MKTYSGEDIKVCRQFVGRREGRGATLDFHWLVAERDREIEYLTDQLVAYLYTVEEHRAAFEAVEFSVTYNPEWLGGRGFFIGSSK